MDEPSAGGTPSAGAAANSYLFGRGVVYTVARVVQLVAALVVTPLVTRRLSAESFGALASATRVSQVIAVVIGLGLPAALARIYFDGDGEDRARLLVVSTAIIAVVLAFGFHLTGPWWSGLFKGLGYGGALQAAVWLAVPVCILEAGQGLLRAADDAAGFVAAAFTSSVVGQLVGMAAVARGGGAGAYLLGVAGATLVAATFAAWRVGALGARPAPAADVRAAIALGGPTVPHLLAMLVIAVGDRVVVERYLGLDQVARYELSYQIGALGVVLLSGLNNAWAPLIYRSEPDERWSILASTTSAVLRVMVPAVGVLCFVGPIGLRILAPGSYEVGGLAAVTSVIAGSSLLYASYLANVHVVFQERRTTVLAWATPVAATVNVLSCIVAVRWFGLVGSAYATVLAFAVLVALTGRAANRLAAIPWEVGSAVGCYGAVAGLVLVGSVLPDEGPWSMGVRAAGATVMALWGFVELRRAWRGLT